MAKHRKQDKPARRTQRVSGIWLWVVAGLAVLVALYSLARTLSHTTAELPPMPILANADQDLVSITRMLGDIEPDTTGFSRLDSATRARLGTADSLVAERDWHGAITKLRPLLKSSPHDARAALHAYLGFCHYQAVALDRALQEYRKSLAADSAGSATVAGSAFSIAYLFQARGMPDSAAAYYVTAETASAETSPLRAAALNNLGVLYEKTGDTTKAAAYYASAAAISDTLADTRTARTLRENLKRIGR